MASAVSPAQLAGSPVFGALPPPALEQLASLLHRRAYKRGQVIFHQDDPGTAAYLIETGCVKVVLLSAEGDEMVLRILAPGEVFGELALLTGRPRSASVIAIEDTVTHTLERDAFLDFLQQRPAAAMPIFGVLTDLIHRLTEQVEDLAQLDVPRRLERKLLELAETYGHRTPTGIRIDVRLNQTELASMIGTTRVSVNNCLAGLERRGIIAREGQRIILRRPEALQPPG
jgi:CRP/FNR family transcriptional regulator, cyclic AMP receptor protein